MGKEREGFIQLLKGLDTDRFWGRFYKAPALRRLLKEGSRWVKLGGVVQHLYQTSLGHTIAGGTSEILRSTVATRGLGLPHEPRMKA